MDKFLDTVFTVLQNLASWVFIAVAGGIWWLVRRILTNQQEIEILRREMAFRDEVRLRDRDDIAEMRNHVKEVRDMLIEYMTHKGNN